MCFVTTFVKAKVRLIFRGMTSLFIYTVKPVLTDHPRDPWKVSYYRWSLNSDLVAESIGNLKGRLRLMHAIYCNMSIIFHENRTILKMEGKYVEETITTINFSYFMIKFKILVH